MTEVPGVPPEELSATITALSGPQRAALLSAPAEGPLYSDVTHQITITTARALENSGLVTLQVWSTWGGIREKRPRTAWSATLTECGKEVVAQLRARRQQAEENR